MHLLVNGVQPTKIGAVSFLGQQLFNHWAITAMQETMRTIARSVLTTSGSGGNLQSPLYFPKSSVKGFLHI